VLVRHTATVRTSSGCSCVTGVVVVLISDSALRGSRFGAGGVQLGGTRSSATTRRTKFGTLLGPEETPGWCCSLAGLLLIWVV
jgi:hypothetical protein